MTEQIAVGQTKTLTAAHKPPDAHIASYAWSESSNGTLLSLVPDGDIATITGVAPGDARVTVATTNGDGTPGPSYSEDVTVIDAAPPEVAQPVEPGAESVSFSWGDVAEVADGAEVAPVISDQAAPSQWSMGEPPVAEEDEHGA